MLGFVTKKWRNMSVGVKSSIAYIISSLLINALSFITVPVFTFLLSTAEMGEVDLYNSWFSIISIVSTLALTSGGYMVALKTYKDNRDQYVSSVLSLTWMVSAVLTVIYLFNADAISGLLRIPKILCVLMICGLFVVPGMNFWIARERYEYKYKKVFIISVSTAIFSTVVSIIAVINWKNKMCDNLGIVRLLASNSITYMVALFVCILIFVKGKTFVNIEYWKYSLGLSIPLIGNAFASQILNVSDRAMIERIEGKSSLGIYGSLYAVSSISLVVWSAINSSFIPFLHENIERKDKQKDIRKNSTVLLMTYATVTFMLTLIAPELIRILTFTTGEYYAAISIIPPIASGIFMISLSNMYTNILIYYKKTSFVMLGTIVAAITNVILNYFCIGKWGYVAAAYTTLFSYIILAVSQGVVTRNICKKAGKINVYDDRVLLLIMLLNVIACMACLLMYNYIFVRYVVCLIFVSMIYVKRRKLLEYFSREVV